MITLTDAEQRFADSPEGRAAIAYERGKFQMSNAYLGDRAPSWTDHMEADLVRRVLTDSARTSIATAAMVADAERQIPELRAKADSARQQMIANLNAPRHS